MPNKMALNTGVYGKLPEWALVTPYEIFEPPPLHPKFAKD